MAGSISDLFDLDIILHKVNHVISFLLSIFCMLSVFFCTSCCWKRVYCLLAVQSSFLLDQTTGWVVGGGRIGCMQCLCMGRRPSTDTLSCLYLRTVLVNLELVIYVLKSASSVHAIMGVSLMCFCFCLMQIFLSRKHNFANLYKYLI